MPEITQAVPEQLRAFRFHGATDVQWRDGKKAWGLCPLCQDDKRKFSVNLSTSQWGCYQCKAEGGNALDFVRLLWDVSDKATRNDQLNALAKDRGLQFPETPGHWGVAVSATTGEWLLPCYGPDGKLHTLYEARKQATGWLVRATPGLWPDGNAAGVFGAGLHDPKKPECWVTEGAWDGMALWEALKTHRLNPDGTVSPTGNQDASMAARINVLAVPGCHTLNRSWLPFFSGKRVVLLYDNDHPKHACGRCGKKWSRHTYPDACPACQGLLGEPFLDAVGLAGMRSAAAKLSAAQDPPSELAWLQWGPEGWDPERKSGYDVRDLLTEDGEMPLKLGHLLGMVKPVPPEWLAAVRTSDGVVKPATVQPVECGSWQKLVNAWRKALQWRQDLEDCLAVAVAMAVSTIQVGDQLFVTLVADAGSAKTRLCEAMLVSRYCYALEHLTGFHSGWKDGSGKDFSLLARINGLLLITAEADVLLSSPNFTQIMSQQRRIFDGSSGASYKNMAEDQRYTGLRTPWLMAGTPALLDTDQSRLGDRFLRVVIDPPGQEEKREILRRVGLAALDSVVQTSNCSPASSIEGNMLHAYQLTGGWVDKLRSQDTAGRLAAVRADTDHDALIDRCSDLAEFVADMRARPNADPRKLETHDTKELPSRLTHQLVRLAACLAVATGQRRVSGKVMRVVRKVALDTAKGRTYNAAAAMRQAGEVGLPVGQLAVAMGVGEDRAKADLGFLCRPAIAVAADFVYKKHQGLKGVRHWRLLPRFADLWDTAHAAEK